jgi:cytochrome c553
MKKIFAFAAGAMLASAAGTALAQSHAEQAARSLAKDVCSACHGPEGHSISPVFPRLAGQQAGYIIVQLEAFRNHTRGDPNAQAYMWGMSSQLSDATIKDLAQYYSAQKPVNGEPGDPALMAEGKKIYTQGIPSQNVPACESCHGARAEGTGAFPRLGGQHVEYLIAQLQGFQSGTRSNAPIMQNVVRTMTPEQLKAAATYAASK